MFIENDYVESNFKLSNLCIPTVLSVKSLVGLITLRGFCGETQSHRKEKLVKYR